MSRNTIRKYLRSDAVEVRFKVPERPDRLDPFADKLSAWLEMEAGKGRKTRRTVRRLHADLVVLGYDGSYARVSAFVRHWRTGRTIAQRTTGRGVFVPLVFPAGDAFQFDWSEDWATVVRTGLAAAYSETASQRMRRIAIMPPETTAPHGSLAAGRSWPEQIFDVLKGLGVGLTAYVPDGGHAELIQLMHDDPAIRTVPLTTEEEGIALLGGAWLGGMRGVLLMQSSGVGNCINMLSLVKTCRFPFLTLVTMRGEWGEFNPWQVPMGSATQAAFALMDVQVLRASDAADVRATVDAGARMAYLGGTPVAVLLSQRLIGAKVFVK